MPKSKSLSPPPSTQILEQGLREIGGMLDEYHATLDSKPVFPQKGLRKIAELFQGTLREEGIGLESALEEVRQWVLPNSMRISHPLYLGLLNSSPLPGAMVAEPLVSGLNNNAGAWQQGPAMVAAEKETLDFFANILGLSPEVSGIILPGGSYTNLHALQLARESKLPQWKSLGPHALTGAPRVYVSDASHFSATRAAQAIGLAKQDIVRVPTLGRGSMDPEKLRALLRQDQRAGCLPFALVATLGTTGTGAIDALPPLLEICKEFDLWLHVDACYGGAGALIEELKPHFHRLSEADSVSVDPHKWFFMPIVSAMLFTKHTQLELDVFDVDAPYIPSNEQVDAFRRSLPTSRRSAGFTIWMALRIHGLQTIREGVRRNIELARFLEEKLEQQGFRVMQGGELSVVCARWETTELSKEASHALQLAIAEASVQSGSAWFGTVHAKNQSWLRFALLSLHTEERHLETLAIQLGEIARGQELPCV